MNTFRLILFLWIFSGNAFAFLPEKSITKSLTIYQAYQQGILKVSIRGVYNPNQVQKDLVSAHYGRCIALRIQNISDSTLSLTLPCGTWLYSKDSSVQNMLVTKMERYLLEPQEVKIQKIYAMCGELRKNAPDIYIRYDVGDVAQQPLMRLAQTIQATQAQNKAGQYAVWAITDRATRRDLGNHVALLQQGQELLHQAGVHFNIFGETTVVLREFTTEDNSMPVLYDAPDWSIQEPENDSIIVNSQTMPIEPETIFLTHETAKLTDDNRTELVVGLGILLVLAGGIFAFGRNYGLKNMVKSNFYINLPEIQTFDQKTS